MSYSFGERIDEHSAAFPILTTVTLFLEKLSRATVGRAKPITLERFSKNKEDLPKDSEWGQRQNIGITLRL